jgi:hypothetical protein
MKTQEANPKTEAALGRLVEELLGRARWQKLRVKERLERMRGDFVSTPTRGPIQKNGRPCIRWHFWKAATAKKDLLTSQIAGIKSRGS